MSTQPYGMSALEMLRLYRTRELSPVEAMKSVIERVEAFEPHIHATYLYAPERALKRSARVRSALGQGRADRSARRRAGDGQGQHRDEGGAEAGRHCGGRLVAAEGGRAAGAALARGGRDHLHQDDYAGLRHAVVGAVELSPAGAQSVEARSQSGRLVGRGGRCGSRALRSAAPRHRHRRLGALAGRLVRHFRPQAERRTDSDRPALHRPCCRPDDARRRRCRVDDGDPDPCRMSETMRASNTRSSTGSSSPRSSKACASAS